MKNENPCKGCFHGKPEQKIIIDSESDGGKYAFHRIPGIVVTKKNTVIIYCEARTGNTLYSLTPKNDWCLMDVYIRRSEDRGETFGEPIYICCGTDKFATVNNPVMIVDNDNTLHMLYCKNYSIGGGGMWHRESNDDGISWSPEREVTGAASVEHDCFAFGPTHGIAAKDGRLMVPVWLVPKGKGTDGDITSHTPSEVRVFYSRDKGRSWSLSPAASDNSDETCMTQLSDGSFMLNSRSHPFRKITVSRDGISGWSKTSADEKLPDPGCCGSVTSVEIPGLPRAILFANCASTERRDTVTVKCSFDDGKTYGKSLLISSSEGGYSDIAVDSEGRVYVLYEVAWGKKLTLARFSYADEFC